MNNKDDLSDLSGEDAFSDESETFNEIMKIYHKEVKNKRSYRSAKLPANVASLMGEANQHFMFNKFDEAIQKAYEIISKYPDYPEPYHLLGLIYEEQNINKKAAQFYTLAAQLTQSDSKLWEKIGYLYKEAACYEQACYSFGRALKSDPNNKMLMLERAECYELAGDIRKAIKAIEKFINHTPDNLLIVKKCAKLYTKINQTQKSIEILSTLLTRDGQTDFNIVNMICELYLKEEKYEECISFIEKLLGITEKEPLANKLALLKEKLNEIPLEIVTKYGVSCGKIYNIEQVYYNSITIMNEAEVAFDILMNDDITTYSDLFLEATESYEEMEQYEKALSIYERLLKLPEYNSAETWLKVGILYRKIKNSDSAIAAFNKVLELNPEKFEAKVQLSEIYLHEGKMQEALSVLRAPDEENGEREEENEEIFLSDEERNVTLEPKLPSIPSRKAKRKLAPEKAEALTKKVKFEDEAYKAISKKEEEEISKPFKVTKENIEARINEIQTKYPIDHLILRFNQAQILLNNGKEKEFLDAIVEPLLQSLRLEIEIQEIRRKVLNRFLYESQKKNFKKKVESGMEFENREMEQNVLLKTKKTKIPSRSEILQKRKTKFSTYLTEKQFENVQSMSKRWSGGKIDYYQLAAKTLKILERDEIYEKLAEACELLIKLKNEFDKYQILCVSDNCRELPNFFDDIHIFGFISNYRLQDFEKAFYFIKYFSKSRTNDNFIQTLLALCIGKIQDPAIYRVFMSKIQIKDLDKECEAINQILGNNYLQTGFYELGINTFYRLYQKDKSNPFLNLLLGVSFLQAASSRTTQNKPQMIIRAFYCFNSYLESRSKAHTCETYYNMARAYSQVSMFKEAIKNYEKAINSYVERVALWEKTFPNREKELPNYDNLFHSSVYNLIIIHKHLGNHEIVKQLINDFMYVKE